MCTKPAWTASMTVCSATDSLYCQVPHQSHQKPKEPWLWNKKSPVLLQAWAFSHHCSVWSNLVPAAVGLENRHCSLSSFTAYAAHLYSQPQELQCRVSLWKSQTNPKALQRNSCKGYETATHKASHGQQTMLGAAGTQPKQLWKDGLTEFTYALLSVTAKIGQQPRPMAWVEGSSSSSSRVSANLLTARVTWQKKAKTYSHRISWIWRSTMENQVLAWFFLISNWYNKFSVSQGGDDFKAYVALLPLAV